MMSEGCVTAYLDAQVLGAAWQAVLQMVPEERNYDLQMVKQVPVVVSLSPYADSHISSPPTLIIILPCRTVSQIRRTLS